VDVKGNPRDFKGYGRQMPDPKWPGDARVALQIALRNEDIP
jgi:hypothetical protein